MEFKLKILIVVSTGICAFFFYDISLVTQFAGMMNILDCLTFIPLFCIAARLIIPNSTPYDFSYMYQVSIVMVFLSLIFFVSSLVSVILELNNP
jgi:hypothetical protein